MIAKETNRSLGEEEERKLSPILTLPAWNTVLKDTGFSGVDFDVPDCDSEDIYTFSVIMSTATEAKDTSNVYDPMAIVTAGEVSAKDENWLKTLQQTVALAINGAEPEICDLERLDSTGKVCIFVGELRSPLLQDPSSAQFEAIRALALKCKGLLWVTRGGAVDCANPEFALSIGFLRSLRKENVGNKYVSFDLDPTTPALSPLDARAVTKVLTRAFDSAITANSSQDFEFAERNGQILVPRLLKDYTRNEFVAALPSEVGAAQIEPFAQADRTLKLEVSSAGLLETLVFCETGEGSEELLPEMVEIEPKAFGLNFRDVMAAMGQLDEQVMGLECAGVVTAVGSTASENGYSVGDRVWCLLGGQYQNKVRVPWTVAFRMPKGLDFETAASMPMIFATAFISLHDIAKLSNGQTVLIHAASGGVGQAAIILAQRAGAKVFATVGTQEKRDFIGNTYGIPDENILSSRDASFAPELMRLTGGCGVDVVLNSLSGQLLQESFNCLAPFGHFVEIGKFDIEHNSRLEMAPFARIASFSSVDLLAMVRQGSPELHRVLASITTLTEEGSISAVKPVTSYPLADIEKAFRQMQAGKHIGKLVLSVSPDETVKVSSFIRILILVHPLICTFRFVQSSLLQNCCPTHRTLSSEALVVSADLLLSGC